MTPAGLPNQGSLPNTARRALQQPISWTASLNVKKRTMNAPTIPADACRHPPHRSLPEPALISIFLLAISHVCDGTSSGSCRRLTAGSPSENTPDIPSSGVFCCCDRSGGGRPTHIVGRRGSTSIFLSPVVFAGGSALGMRPQAVGIGQGCVRTSSGDGRRNRVLSRQRSSLIAVRPHLKRPHSWRKLQSEIGQ